MGFFDSKLFIILSITFFLFQSILHLSVDSTKDTLFQGDDLDSQESTSILLSAGGKYTMGFFTTQYSNLTYLGIWYTAFQDTEKVWVANRDIPIVGDGRLTLDDSGTMRVKNRSGATLFNVSNDKFGSGYNNKKYNNTRAMLQDSGNFIVYDELNRTIWQSFDYPTDTLLPGMKLGYNLTTGQNWTMTSSTDDGFVASGIFTLRFERYQNSPQLLIHRRGVLYWASGPWNESTKTFPYLLYSDSYIWNVISDASGMYCTCQTNLLASSILQISPDGRFGTLLTKFTPDFCYGDDDGCVISDALPYCRGTIASTSDVMWERYTRSVRDFKIEENSSISIGDCMKRCWNDCNCIACSTYTNGTGCMYWTQSFFGDDFPGTTSRLTYSLYPRHSHKKKNKWRRWTLFSILIVPIFVLTYVMIKRRIIKGKENRKKDEFLTGSDSFNYGDELERSIKEAPDVKIFNLKAIMAATNNFSDENKLGEGGYGPVYKGILSDGREIAVKRLSKSSGQGIMEFKSELILISKLQHTNLVRLYGCCIHQEEKMIIYEFMPNKSLDFFLFAQDEKEKIGWHVRFNIIEGVAQGLLYLHRFSRMKVIHRDLKVGNVLLDENMNPKIADFGMARIFQQNVTEAVTHRIVGTYGYMAPEYAIEGTFSIKSDVFSFGVLIIEIVSGRRNSRFYNPDRPLNLVGYTWELWKGHASLELKDETLKESYDVKQLLRVIHVGLLCVQDNADDRPTMSDVIYILKNESIKLPSPKKPTIFTGRQNAGFCLNKTISTDYLLGRQIPSSEIILTVTTIEAR